MVWATLAISILSACRLKMSKVMAACRASRSVSVLAEDELGRDLGPWRIPDAPFVDHQLGEVIRIEPGHLTPVLLDDGLGAEALAEHGVPLRGRREIRT